VWAAAPVAAEVSASPVSLSKNLPIIIANAFEQRAKCALRLGGKRQPGLAVPLDDKEHSREWLCYRPEGWSEDHAYTSVRQNRFERECG